MLYNILSRLNQISFIERLSLTHFTEKKLEASVHNRFGGKTIVRPIIAVLTTGLVRNRIEVFDLMYSMDSTDYQPEDTIESHNSEACKGALYK